MTPLDWAIHCDAEPSVRALFECGVDPYSAGLEYAPKAITQRPNMARVLIEAGVDVNTKSHRGNSCLHHAVMSERGTALTKVLLEYNVDVNARNILGETALTIAAYSNHHSNKEVVRLLLSHGADAQAANIKGATALHRMAMHDVCSLSSLECLKTRSKCDYNDEIADRQRTLGVVRLLLEAGADPDAPDVSGITPVHVAISRRAYETAALLLSYSKHYHVPNPEAMS